MKPSIFSEIGPLEKVFVHSPGEEHNLVSPSDVQPFVLKDGQIIENENLLVEVIPSLGGRVDKLVNKSSNYNWVWNNPFLQKKIFFMMFTRTCKSQSDFKPLKRRKNKMILNLFKFKK